MKNPIINFQSYLEFRKDDYAKARFGVLYGALSSMGQELVNDEIGGEYIKIFNVLYN